jgi:histone H3/H4
MTELGLLLVKKQGRHRYHRLASRAVAQMLESIMQVAADRATPARRLTVGPGDAALRAARTCYDHLA